MASIVTLAAKLTANTAPFNKKMKGARKHVTAFSSSVAQTAKRMSMFGGAMAALAAGGLLRLVKQQAKVIDQIGKLSDVLNITTEGLISFQYGATLSGASAEAMNKALEIFVRRMGEATSGSGEAIRGLEMLNLRASDLVAMDTGEAIKLVADRINTLPTAAKKAAAAYFMLGRGGMALSNFLMLGSKGIALFEKEARRLGITVSRIDAAQVEALNDSVYRLKQAFVGIGRTLAIHAAPYVEALAEHFTDMMTDSASIKDSWDSIAKSMAWVANSFSDMGSGWRAMKATGLTFLEQIYRVPGLASGELKAFGKPIIQIETTFGKETADMLAARSAELMHEANRLASAPRVAESIIANAEAQARKSAQAARGLPVLDQLDKAISDIRGARRMKQYGWEQPELRPGAVAQPEISPVEFAKRTQRAQAILAATQTPLERFTEGQKELQDLLAGKHITPDIHERAMAQLLTTYEDQDVALNEAKQAAEEYAKSVASLWEETRTPLEQYEIAMGRLDELIDKGALGLDTYWRQANLLNKTLEDSTGITAMADEAKQLWDSTRTPLEQYQSQLEKINELMVAGFLDVETAARAAADAREGFLGAADAGRPDIGEALTGRHIRHVALNGPRGVRKEAVEVKSAQTDRTNELLQAIRLALFNGVPATALV